LNKIKKIVNIKFIMEGRTGEIVRSHMFRVSPYQQFINHDGKTQILERFPHQLWLVWAIPIVLTFAEGGLLRAGRGRQANLISLPKWISYILAACYSNFLSANLLRDANYYNIIYPNPPQTQLEAIRDAEIFKKTQYL
jgi:hypothetical protein